MFFLNGSSQLSQHARATNSCHVFQTDFGSTGFDKLVGNGCIILHCVNGRESDAKSCLRNHACCKCILNRRNDVSDFIQPTEDTGDIYSLSFFNLIHQFTYVGRNRVHAQAVKTTIKHVSLNACFIKKFSKLTNCFIRIFSVKQVHLFKSSSIRLYAGKTTHLDDQWSNTYQLIYTRLILS